MSTPLLVKLREAAIADTSITALLGTLPCRWYNKQLTEGSAFPAITTRQIDAVPVYNVGQRGNASVYRIQFTIWEGYTPDDTNSVLDALRAFLDTFSATQTSGQAANQIVNVRDGLYAETQTAIFQTFVDAFIYNDDAT